MKTFTTLLLLIGLKPFVLICQYTPFPVANAQWNNLSVVSQAGGEQLGTWNYLMSGDTTMNGQVYQKIYVSEGTSQIFLGGLRESENRQVYFLPKNQEAIGSFIATFPNTEEEFLLYDFSSHEIGFVTQYPDYSATLLEYDSTEVNGVTYRRYRYENYSMETCAIAGPEYWVYEGIGSEFGLFAPYGCQLEVSYYLMCFSAEGATFENLEIPYAVDNCVLPVQELNEPTPTLIPFPNPCRDNIRLEINSAFAGQIKIRIMDAFGSEVMPIISETISSHSKKNVTVDLSSVSAGTYFALTEIDGVVVSSRFIKLP